MSEIDHNTEARVNDVRERYGRIATGEIAGCGCGLGAGSEESLAIGIGYGAGELAELPEEANLGLGCGAPIAHLAPKAGETVLDLGSGAGIDAFLAARRVGPSGRVIGVDMTPEMIAKAEAGAARLGYANVEFRSGRLEELPVEDASIDAITSNCVINLVPDKNAVFREMARVLAPGGRVVVSDIVLSRALPPAIEKDLLAYVGCISGAALEERYFADLAAAGLDQIEILRESDYVEVLLATAPAEVDELLRRTGVTLDDVRGVVRSVTYRAQRSGEAACCGPEGCEPCGCPPAS